MKVIENQIIGKKEKRFQTYSENIKEKKMNLDNIRRQGFIIKDIEFENDEEDQESSSKSSTHE